MKENRTFFNSWSSGGIAALILCWNLTVAIAWIGWSEGSETSNASEKYGHILDPEERSKRMLADIEVAAAPRRPYYPAILATTGVNFLFALWTLRQPQPSGGNESVKP